MPQDLIEREVLIEASRQRVWAALTDPEHVAGWFGDTAQLDLRRGGRAVFGWRDQGVHHAVILRVAEPDVLAYRWARDTDTEPADGNSTVVEFSLTDVFAGTLLRVVETGFASLHVTDDEQAKAAQDNADGWQSELADLKEYAERPSPSASS